MNWMVPTLIALAFPVLTTASAAVEPGSRQRTFVRALEVFDAAKAPGDYRESAALLESLLVDGFRNGAVYYNLGNAYFRAGEYGRSIAAYRKAKLYRPRDPYLDANLRQCFRSPQGTCPNRLRPGGSTCCSGAAGCRFPKRRTHRSVVFCWRPSRHARFVAPPTALCIGSVRQSLVVGRGFECRCRPGLWATWPGRGGVVTRETIARKGIGKDYEPAFDQPLKDAPSSRSFPRVRIGFSATLRASVTDGCGGSTRCNGDSRSG